MPLRSQLVAQQPRSTRWMYFSRAARRPSARLRAISLVVLGLQVAERQVLELPLDLPDAQPIGQRRVDLHRLLGDAPLLVGRQILERPHVVQAIGQLDEHHADVLGHGQEHLAHVLGPDALLRAAVRPSPSASRGSQCILPSLVTPSTRWATSAPEVGFDVAPSARRCPRRRRGAPRRPGRHGSRCSSARVRATASGWAM